MNRSVAPGPGRPPLASSVRSAVVPTAITRPAVCNARAVSSGTKYRSRCMRWSSTRAERTGRKVPGPTCRVIAVTRMRRAHSAVLHRALAARQDQEPRGVALRQWRLGDQILGELVVELGDVHDAASIPEGETARGELRR